MNITKAYLHSIETFGALDGPGIRTVVFLQGCPLRCKFCHTIDTTIPQKGEIIDIETLFQRVIKNKEYWADNGGVTISGGEPTFQPEFLLAFLKKLKQEKIHTAVDSCLYTNSKVIDEIFPYVDYWMVSIKHLDSAKHKELTGRDNQLIQENLRHLDDMLSQDARKDLRIRFVLIPGITDDESFLHELTTFLKNLKSLDIFELLGYGEHGKDRWVKLFGSYPLEGKTREAKIADLERAKAIFEKEGVRVKY